MTPDRTGPQGLEAEIRPGSSSFFQSVTPTILAAVALAANTSDGRATTGSEAGVGETAQVETQAGPQPPAEAGTADDGKPFLDTITVSARKRDQSLEDVPVAVSVLEGEDLEGSRITTLEEATAAVPAVTVSDTPGGDAIFVRGVGSGVNVGFEQSVGTFIDGVYYGRGHSARNPFLDVDRIEVLKGPQSVLFGKNTIGGAFNVITRKPTADARGSVAAFSEPELGALGVTGVLSGPLSEAWFARLAGRAQSSDGYLENSLIGRTEPGRDERVGRLTVDWMPSDSVSVRIKAEGGAYGVTGGPSQITRASPLLRTLALASDPQAEFELDFRKSGPGRAGSFAEEFDDTETLDASVTVAWQAGGHSFTSLSSFVGFDRHRAADTDFSPLDFIRRVEARSYRSVAQELRLTSPRGRRVDYVAGVYWADERLENEKPTTIDFDAVPPLAAVFRAGGFPLAGERQQRFEQETTTWSIFVQPTLDLSDSCRISAGLRYTREAKDADKDLFYTDVGSTTVNPSLGVVYSLLGLGTPHRFLGLRREEDDLSASVTLEYDAGSTLSYLSVTQGFKAGGFDEDNAAGSLAAQEFEDEGVDAFELGVKSVLAGGRAQLGASIFHNTFDDLQVSTFDGVASFVVGNAAGSISRGAELDVRWAATKQLTVAGAWAYLDAEYEEYPAGPCAFGTTDPAGNPLTVCDLAGRNLQFSPRTSAHLSAHVFDVLGTGDWSYSMALDATYSGEYDVPGDLDPLLAQDSFWKLNVRLGLYTGRGWELAVYGRNLTGEKTTSWGNDLPLSNLLGNNVFQLIDEPRMLGLRLSYVY